MRAAEYISADQLLPSKPPSPDGMSGQTETPRVWASTSFAIPSSPEKSNFKFGGRFLTSMTLTLSLFRVSVHNRNCKVKSTTLSFAAAEHRAGGAGTPARSSSTLPFWTCIRNRHAPGRLRLGTPRCTHIDMSEVLTESHSQGSHAHGAPSHCSHLLADHSHRRRCSSGSYTLCAALRSVGPANGQSRSDVCGNSVHSV